MTYRGRNSRAGVCRAAPAASCHACCVYYTCLVVSSLRVTPYAYLRRRAAATNHRLPRDAVVQRGCANIVPLPHAPRDGNDSTDIIVCTRTERTLAYVVGANAKRHVARTLLRDERRWRAR